MRIRVRFAKDGPARFASALDFARMLARAATRAGIAMEYSRGHTPRPRIATGPALPVGVRSSAEYADFQLAEETSPEDFAARLAPVLPEGVRLLGAWELPEGAASLSASAAAAEYRCRPLPGRARSVAEGLRGVALDCRAEGEDVVVVLECAPSRTVNPISALEAAGIPREESLLLDIERTALYTTAEGRFVPPEEGLRGVAVADEEGDADKRGRGRGPRCGA